MEKFENATSRKSFSFKKITSEYRSHDGMIDNTMFKACTFRESLTHEKIKPMRASTNNIGLEMIAASTFLCWIIIQNERKAQKHDDFHNNLWSAWAFCFADWMTLTLPWWKLDAMTKINRLYAVCCLEIYLLGNLFVCCCLSEVILFLNGWNIWYG